MAQAEKKAAAIVADAEAKAQELNKNTRAELKLFAEHSVRAIKTEVANIITIQKMSVRIANFFMFSSLKITPSH